MKNKYLIYSIEGVNLCLLGYYFVCWIKLNAGFFYPEGYRYLFPVWFLFAVLITILFFAVAKKFLVSALLSIAAIVSNLIIVNSPGRKVPLSGLIVCVILIIVTPIMGFRGRRRTKGNNNE
jgi:hypothetical protein